MKVVAKTTTMTNTTESEVSPRGFALATISAAEFFIVVAVEVTIFNTAKKQGTFTALPYHTLMQSMQVHCTRLLARSS
ncbi:unnamed protein product [Mesocestoides corti]|uniref:Uncharacterized protein n=1 Tax=Mesocestoides corti TaxID=53468 RepID=A0A0R3UDD3_MESCO|nr:unnamed protein product [Mesocestoides corti]